jgi:TM2 domain-containing membrane protein YozV
MQQKKSLGIAYLLLIFVGSLGLHHFYLGNTNKGIAYLATLIIGGALSVVLVGLAVLAVLGVILFVELFTLPKMVREANNRPHNNV